MKRTLKGLAKGLAHALPPLRRLVDERDRLSSELAQVRDRERRVRARNRQLRRAVRAVTTGTSPVGPGEVSRGTVPTAADGQPLRFLFVVAYGRSGSTLVQGILNSIPGYLIRGENGGVLTHVYRGHAIATDLKARFPSKRLPRHAMFGIQDYPVDVATRELRHYAVHTLLRPEADTRVVGFKEIRWHEEDSLGFVAFLQSTFPGARFVVNTRDLDEVSRSKWWAQRENARAELEETQAGLLRIADQLGDAAFHVHYNDYADSPETLRDLFDWLGEPFELDRVKAVLAERHSF